MEALVRVPGGSGPVSLRVHPIADDEVSRTLCEHGVWEPFETAIVDALVRPGDRFFDVGANLGYYSVVASGLAGPDGAVHAFEPDPSNLALLEANARTAERQAGAAPVRVHAVACAERPGEATLYRAEDNRGDHRLAPADEPRDTVTVPTTTLDDVASEVGDPDFVKIDTQGSEPAILRGARAWLARCPDATLLLEYWPHGLERAGESTRRYVEAARLEGRSLFAVFPDDDRLHPATTDDLERWGQDILSPARERFVTVLVVSDPNRVTALPQAGYLLAAGSRLSFANGGAGLGLRLSAGWSFSESWGTWSDGPVARLRVALGDASVLRLRGHAFASAEHPMTIDFAVDERVVRSEAFDGMSPRSVDLPLPAAADAERPYAEIQIAVDRPRSPRAVDGRPDDRALGFGLAWLERRTA